MVCSRKDGLCLITALWCIYTERSLDGGRNWYKQLSIGDNNSRLCTGSGVI